MDLFDLLDISPTTEPALDLDMTPDLAFTTFVSSGFHAEQCKDQRRVLYCYLDAWKEEPLLLLMEQGVKYSRVLARIDAPLELRRACVANPETASILRRVHAIDTPLRQWLAARLEARDWSCLHLLHQGRKEEGGPSALPLRSALVWTGEHIRLPAEPQALNEEEITREIRAWNFFDQQRNPGGGFATCLADNGDGLTVTDVRTGLVWQRGGLDLASIRLIKRGIERLWEERFAGWHDWRLPSLHEALSLMTPEKNGQGLHLDTCFSREQPFVYVATRCRPGGYWLVDFRQGRVFRGSGSSPGGFARLCRSED